ncbi:hypothetical protein QYF36_003837 [Acer negundo]|nr:hypothetical protein QYF36_003837 [Acer negundo]
MSVTSHTQRTKVLHLRNLLHVPQIAKNLLGISRFTHDNNSIAEFYDGYCLIKDKITKKTLLKGTLKDGLYKLELKVDTKSGDYFLQNATAFVSDLSVSALNKKNIVDKATVESFSSCHKSLPCVNMVASDSDHAATSRTPLELVYSDIWGPSPIISSTGHRYYISFVDDYIRFTWLYPIVLKSEALSVFLNFKKYVELQFQRKIQAFQSDMEMEFQSFSSKLKEFGIAHRFSCAYTHQQNGIPERKHRHIVETGLTLLAHAKVPLKFWSDAFASAVLIINNLPTPVLNNISPFEKLYNRQPNYSIQFIVESDFTNISWF